MITQKELKRLLCYDSDTGYFTWLVRKRGIKSICPAGNASKKDGYRYIGINGKTYMAHRLAWLYMTGFWPKNQIDHDDHVRDNNRWINLNETTNQENHMNQSLRKDNTSGFTGVYLHKPTGNWEAKIKVNYKSIYLGCFEDKSEAIKARKEADSKFKFHKNHGQEYNGELPPCH